MFRGKTSLVPSMLNENGIFEQLSPGFEKIKDRAVRQAIKAAILEVEAARKLTELTHVKKMEGFRNAYRLRVGEFRIGFFLENDTVVFARAVNRKDIYDVFP